MKSNKPHVITMHARAQLKTALGLAAVALAILCAPASALAAECPNEQFRTGASAHLPDCRAYELVTPVRKNGAPPVINEAGIAASGSRLSFSSLGAFNEPGNASTTEGGEYIAVRGTSGWSTTAVNPSATEFFGGSPDRIASTRETSDFNKELTRSLFIQAPLSGKPIDSRIYLREASTGAFTEVGPVIPPGTVAGWTAEGAELAKEYYSRLSYLGGTGTLSHVVFTQLDGSASLTNSAFDWLWPGDATFPFHLSLYQYVGTGNREPELVGVKNQTTLASAQAAKHLSHLNEAAELVSQCGTGLGDFNSGEKSESAYNAISDTGEVVYFTAFGGGCTKPEQATPGEGPPVAVLDARIDRASTVAISEPTAESCSACDLSEVTSLPWNGREFEFTGTPEEKSADEHRAGELRPFFQGASEDGSRVFFVSRQRLFGGAHEEHGANLYEYDFSAPAGQRVSLVAPDLPQNETPGGGVVRVADSGALVYFVSEDALASNLDALGKDAQGGEGNFNLYVFDTRSRTTTFIAALAQGDEADWSTLDERPVEATRSGQFLLFPSVNELTPDAAGSMRQLYRYEAPSASSPDGKLTRVTVGEDGFNDNGNVIPAPEYPFGPQYGYSYATYPENDAKPSGVAITTDGRVFFESPIALTPEAVNEACAFESEGECAGVAQNVYEWDEGHVYLISDGRDTHSLFRFSATRLIGATPSGSDVFITSADPLVAQDGDTQVDVYDARVDGGFPEPPSPTTCDGETCQGAIEEPSPPPAAASAIFEGQGNLHSPATPAVTKQLTRQQKLTKALAACRKHKRKKPRQKCERQARSRYGVKAKAPSKTKKRSK